MGSEGVLKDYKGYFRKFQRVFSGFRRCNRHVTGCNREFRREFRRHFRKFQIILSESQKRNRGLRRSFWGFRRVSDASHGVQEGFRIHFWKFLRISSGIQRRDRCVTGGPRVYQKVLGGITDSFKGFSAYFRGVTGDFRCVFWGLEGLGLRRVAKGPKEFQGFYWVSVTFRSLGKIHELFFNAPETPL